MSIESELKKLREAIVDLKDVLANAALGAPARAGETVKDAVKKVAVANAGSVAEEVRKKAGAMAKSAGENAAADTSSACVGGGKYADAANSSVDEIRARLRPVIEKEGPAPIQATLKALGVDMLTSLAAEQYPALLSGVAEAIGAEV